MKNNLATNTWLDDTKMKMMFDTIQSSKTWGYTSI
jgi:hypothetical protein